MQKHRHTRFEKLKDVEKFADFPQQMVYRPRARTCSPKTVWIGTVIAVFLAAADHENPGSEHAYRRMDHLFLVTTFENGLER